MCWITSCWRADCWQVWRLLLPCVQIGPKPQAGAGCGSRSWLRPVLAGWGLRRMDRWLPEAAPRANPAQTHSSAWRIIGLLCLGLCLGLTLWIVIRLWPDYSNWAGTAGPWLWALALMLAGGYLLAGLKPNLDEQPAEANAANPLRIPAWLEALLFLGIAALAVYLRLHRLDEIPSGIYVDETNGALDALHILEGNGASPFATGWYGVPNGYIFYMAGLFKAFGASYLTLKAVSLIPAILTVWAVYPLGRLLFGSLGGLCAMFLLAVSRWHLSMSRWGWAELPPLLFQILATFFLLRGLRDKRASDFAIGGLLSGLMMYTYLSSRLALATLGVFALVYLLLQKGGPFRAFKQHWQGLALFLLAFMVAFAPLAVTHITDPFTFNNRVDQISIFKDTADAGSLQTAVPEHPRSPALLSPDRGPAGQAQPARRAADRSLHGAAFCHWPGLRPVEPAGLALLAAVAVDPVWPGRGDLQLEP